MLFLRLRPNRVIAVKAQIKIVMATIIIQLFVVWTKPAITTESEVPAVV